MYNFFHLSYQHFLTHFPTSQYKVLHISHLSWTLNIDPVVFSPQDNPFFSFHFSSAMPSLSFARIHLSTFPHYLCTHTLHYFHQALQIHSPQRWPFPAAVIHASFTSHCAQSINICHTSLISQPFTFFTISLGRVFLPWPWIVSQCLCMLLYQSWPADAFLWAKVHTYIAVATCSHAPAVDASCHLCAFWSLHIQLFQSWLLHCILALGIPCVTVIWTMKSLM